MAQEKQRQREHANLFALVAGVLADPPLSQQPIGSFIVVNVDTGEYVTAPTLIDANTRFLERFPRATGFAHRIGEPLLEPLSIP